MRCGRGIPGFSKGVMERICRQKTGLFPAPAEIQFSCRYPG